ncbi:MAG: M48 family metalloprotease [Alphaproteobacteria bacterium]|nr:M48 family metalloprotease [Alphaproteobacteria bacterium]USO07469.1 MAG: M48 family metalloprotease [Rhodospirillales bacterium]
MIRKSFAVIGVCLLLAACSTNEATGRSQFTGLMNTAQENAQGAEAETAIQKQYGVVEDPKITAFVNTICARLTPGLERRDVAYRCTVLDSPVVNAFALPGGYINVNRGLLAYAENEAEVAGVLAHEMGHVTARHISERYSQSALTQLGGSIASAALGSSAANSLISLGSNLYLSSYSRGQESEADDLGIRYMSRAGYDPRAMASFLATLQRESALSAAEQGEQYKEMRGFMATHPMTGDRVARAVSIAANTPNPGTYLGEDTYFNAVNGLVYGDSPKDGYVRGQEFVHPTLGFAFMAPASFVIKNAPDQVIGQARSNSGATFVFNAAAKPAGMDPASYITQVWMKGRGTPGKMESITVNGMRAATAQIQGTINGTPALMRLVAIEWAPDTAYRFQFAMPQATKPGEIDTFKRMTYSLRRMNQAEAGNTRPKRIAVVTAGAGQTVAGMAKRMAFDDGLNEQRFRALNALGPGDALLPGRQYKIIVQ